MRSCLENLYSELKEKADKHDKIVQFTKKNNCAFTKPDSRRMFGLAFYFALLLSLIAANRFIVCMFYAIFYEHVFHLTPSGVVNISPRESIYVISDAATDVFVVSQRKTKFQPLFFIMDVANKDGTHHMVKEMCAWDWETHSLFRFALYCDACVGTDMKAAKAVDFP